MKRPLSWITGGRARVAPPDTTSRPPLMRPSGFTMPHVDRSLKRMLLICTLVLVSEPCVADTQGKQLPMPGTVFKVDGRTAFVIEPPEAVRGDGPMPWVWYAPTLKRLPSAAEVWMFERFLAAGVAVAGVDVGESYGSPEGRAGYDALYRELLLRGYGKKPVLLARSRGGLMLYSWAVEHPQSVAGVAGIYPVCDLTSYPGLAPAATAYRMTAAKLESRLTEFNPIDRLAPLARAGVPILHVHGDKDRTVPLEANSEELRKRYAALGGPVAVRVVKGRGHDMWPGWFQSRELTEFVIARAHGRTHSLDASSGVSGTPPTLTLASPFVDGMILQRNMGVPVWGWARPGARVTVGFAGQSKTSIADPRGRWRVTLDPLAASHDQRRLTVRTNGGDAITRHDVLVGEVWLASGQSNMDWVAGKSMCRELANQLQRSKVDEPVREYAVDIGSSVFVRTRADSTDGWKRSGRAGSFSALALAFAWELHQALDVPIGILRSTHGATAIETWTPYEGFADHPRLQHVAARIRQSDPTTADGQKAYARFYEDLRVWQADSERRMGRGGRALPRPKLPGIGEDWKGPSRMYNRKIAPLVPFAIRGVIWCQGTHNASDGKIYAAKMEALVNGLRKTWARPRLPFYFTQMQCYGKPDVDSVGFADIREAQRAFFMRSKNVGMVLQHDLNPERPSGIHYYNKLDPGKRLARWALAHDYGRDIPFTGPIYASHRIDGNRVRVRFEQRGKGGGLMVGTKGMEADRRRSPDAYVEPARAAAGDKLRHFRLAGRDRTWHAADAVIDGDEVVVTSPSVPEPVGVQYAYSGSPIGANLYNQAGLPATPFAYLDGKQLFQEDLPEVAAKGSTTQQASRKPYVQVATPFRAHAVIQRDRPVPVWGFALPGTRVTVRFAGQSKITTAGEFEGWQVTLDPMGASAKGRDLVVTCSDGASRTVPDVVVGDLWVLTGSTRISGELIPKNRDPSTTPPLPLVREFRIRTKARRFREPRKRRMEIGGGKYVSRWRTASFAEASPDVSVAGYAFAARVQEAGVPIGVMTLGADNPPITWISYEGLQRAIGFEKERDELNLLYPDTEAGKAAVSGYIETLKDYNRKVSGFLSAGDDLPDDLAESPPAFPQPKRNQWAKHTENATLTYNFCISPLTPHAIRGVVWIPGPHNIGKDVGQYAPAMRALAASLAETYGQPNVPFFYAQPSPDLVEGITNPKIENAVSLEFDRWPKSLHDIATRLGALAARGQRR